MPSDREAFMRAMGLTEDDVADPGRHLPPGSTSTRRTSSSKSPVGRTHISVTDGNAALRGGYANSSTTASTFAAPPPPVAPSLSASPNGVDMAAKRRAFLVEMGLTEAGMPLPTTNPSPHPTEGFPTMSSAFTASRNVISCNGGSVCCGSDTGMSSAGGGALTDRLKAAGNDAFERGDFVEAVSHYSDAIEAGRASNADATLMAALYSNRSAAYLQGAKRMPSPETAYDRALRDADEAVALCPGWFKGYSRQGDVYFKTQRYHQAAEAYDMALQLQPGNMNLANSLRESQDRARSMSRDEWQSRRQSRKQQQQQQQQQSSLNASGTYRSSLASSTRELASPASLGYEDGGDRSTSLNTTGTFSKFGNQWSSENGSRAAAEMWSELKVEVKNSVPEQVTGDEYRRLQLERFRQQREAKAAQLFGATKATTTSAMTTTASTPTAAAAMRMDSDVSVSEMRSQGRAASAQLNQYHGNAATAFTEAGAATGERVGSQVIPDAFSSTAASAYQQRLLEQFRQRKMMTQ